MRRTGLAVAVVLMSWACVSPPSRCIDCSSGAEPPSVTIAAVGDISGHNLWTGADTTDPLEGVRALLTPHDVFLFNLEGPILSAPPSGACPGFPGQSSFWSGPWLAEFLRPTPVAVATLANNHIVDCGTGGIDATLEELAQRRISTIGAGVDLDRACRPLRLQLGGMRLAVVAYLEMNLDPPLAKADRAGAASWEACRGDAQVRELARTVDLVLVVLHLHLASAWAAHAPAAHIAAVERALAAGADVVIGHGPHVVQAVIERHGRLGLLSLGNFLLRPDYRMPERAHRSVIAKLIVSRETIHLDLIALRLDDFGRPYVPSGDDGTAIVSDVAAQSEQLGTNLTVDTGVARVMVERTRAKVR